MAKSKHYVEEEIEEEDEELPTKSRKHSTNSVSFAGSKSIASTILWIALVVCILNIGVIIINVVGKQYWSSYTIPETTITITIAPWWYIFQPIISGISLFLLSGTSILVIPLNKTLKKERARTFGTWFWGLIIWIFSVFYVVMFFFNIIAPVLNLLIAIKVLDISPLNHDVIYWCNTVMGLIPLVTIIAAGILYGRVKATYRKRHGQ